jgi:hypothetical protein
MTDNARERKYRINNCLATLPFTPGTILIILSIQGDRVHSAFCDEDEPGWCYNPRWTKMRYYKQTDHFSKFIQRDGHRFDLTHL